ncbi:DNA polymerase III, partial [Candidatus Parcubacteria bacterium]|nr:DNA polymerase III [Candidatus Parcubacteria bacterium]
MHRFSNSDIAKILTDISIYLEMDSVPFKPRAYEKVAQTVELLDEPIADIYAAGGLKAIEAIPGVGEGIGEKIEELLNTGRLKYHEALKKKIPVDVGRLSAIEGVGPKMIKVLWQKLRVRTLADLERAARAGRIRKLAGFGVKTEENILEGIGFLKQSGGRFPLGEVVGLVDRIVAQLREVPGVSEAIAAGSIRRRKETVGDADILVVSTKPAKVMDEFVHMDAVGHVYAHGETKSMVRLRNGLDVDLRVVPARSFGAALNYFTGSKEHNVALRELAVKKGWKFSEYGLFRASPGAGRPRGRASETVRPGGRTRSGFSPRGQRQIAGRTEEDLYRKFGLEYIAPELREMTGELEAARTGHLPKLIGYGDLRGDLQMHTDWTDGTATLAQMVAAAREAGLEYVAITDHTKSLAMTGGLDERGLARQAKEIDTLNRKFKTEKVQFRVLKSAEVNIKQDGLLDVSDEALAKLDVVGAAVHSHFNLSRRDQTERIVRAISNPHVDILFHPTGRLLGRRKAYDVDLAAIIAVAKQTRTVLEIDADPARLDLSGEYVRQA